MPYNITAEFPLESLFVQIVMHQMISLLICATKRHDGKTHGLIPPASTGGPCSGQSCRACAAKHLHGAGRDLGLQVTATKSVTSEYDLSEPSIRGWWATLLSRDEEE